MTERIRDAVALAAKGRTIKETLRVNLPAGECTFEFSLRPVLDDRGAVIAIVPEAMEITERLKAEERLRQSQKMEAVGQLTGGIAHDFNNMLAIIIGGLELIERRLAAGNTDVTRYLTLAKDGVTRASALTNRLLAFARRQPLTPEPVDANAMVSGMGELLGRTLGGNVTVQTVLAADLWGIFADVNQLENVVLNLAVNARDAMPDGGTLTIETSNTTLDESGAADLGVPAGDYVVIAVGDTGTGMPPEIVARAFEPFFTTKSLGKGTGLGLSQVFGFVRQSGGQVRILSEVGVGTTVRIYLPRRGRADAQAAAKLASAVARGGSAHEVVLVVEDEARVRSYVAEALRELGYTVIEAASGAEALGIIEAGEKVALLFTDVIMPEMAGRQLAAAAARTLPQLKVLFTTGASHGAEAQPEELDPGANFLAKPFGINQLAAKVRSVLDS